MPATYAWQYGFVPDDAPDTELLIEDETSSEEIGIGSRLAKSEFQRINGLEVEEMGDTSRAIKISWRLKGDTAADLRAAMLNVESYRGELGTLTIRGGEGNPWQNCVMDGPPRYSARTPPQTDGSVSCRCEVTFLQLDASEDDL